METGGQTQPPLCTLILYKECMKITYSFSTQVTSDKPCRLSLGHAHFIATEIQAFIQTFPF